MNEATGDFRIRVGAVTLATAGLARWGGVLLTAGLIQYVPQFHGPAPVRTAHGLILTAGCLCPAAGMWSQQRPQRAQARQTSATAAASRSAEDRNQHGGPGAADRLAHGSSRGVIADRGLRFRDAGPAGRGSGYGRGCYPERVRPCDLAGDTPVQRIAVGITAADDRYAEHSGGTRAPSRVRRNGGWPGGVPHRGAAHRGG